MEAFVHPTAIIDPGVTLGPGTKVWHFTHLLPGTEVGRDCTLGQNVMVGPDVRIGDSCKIQNNVSIYNGVELEDYVFCGPFDGLHKHPRPPVRIPPAGQFPQPAHPGAPGASIGANATIVCGITIGKYAFIGAGAVVTTDVPDYALMLGVPAVRAGWMSRHGARLHGPDAQGVLTCARSGWRYREDGGILRCLDWGEDTPVTGEGR